LAVSLIQAYRIGRYIAGQKLRGTKRCPLVLMLEPLLQCNLACSGCGKISHPKEILRKRMSVEEALSAVDECGAPMVSIPGGEPRLFEWAARGLPLASPSTVRHVVPPVPLIGRDVLGTRENFPRGIA
jgi:hypothetical protein